MTTKHEAMIEQIHRVLVGCEEYKEEGLIVSHSKVKAKVNKHELYFRILFGFASVSAFVVTFWKDLKELFT